MPSLNVQVKNIDYVWHAFMPEGVIKSAGVTEIVDMVNENWPPLEPGTEISWTVSGNKFVVKTIEKKKGKLSKS